MATFCISSIEPSLKQRILQEAGLPEMSDRNLGSLIGSTCIRLGIDKSLYEKYIDVIIPKLINLYKNQLISIEEEEQIIKEKAIKDGTFMRAPNGNPTNLTEKQWLQVRTKAFKDWFGDWEKGLAVQQDNNSFYRGQFDEPSIDKNGNLVLTGRKDSLYERAGYKISKGVSVTRDLKSAIDYGEGQLETRINLVMDSSMDESEQDAVIDNGYYLIQFKDSVSNEEIKEAGESKLAGDVSIPEGSYIIEHYVQGELVETIGKINNNNASKVVDENGEPLVVYHGSSKVFNEFDVTKSIRWNVSKETGNKHFFSSSKEVANFFVGDDYISLLNAISYQLEIGDFGDSTEDEVYAYIGFRLGKSGDEVKNVWKNAIKKGDVNKFGDVVAKANKEGKFYPVFLNMKEAIELNAKGERADNYIYNNKDVINNSNNVIIKYINETVGDVYGTDYLVTNPNNIKSAEDNVGLFSKEDNVIYNNKDIKDTYDRLLKKAKSEKLTVYGIKKFNEQHHTNFGINPNTGGITTRNPKLYGVSIYNPNDTKVVAKKRIDRALLLDYLQHKFNLNFKQISSDEYNKRFGKASNCSVEGNTVYIRETDLNTLTNEQLIEEFLHPAVHAIYISNPELANNLLEEARKNFPDLVKQIEYLYDEKHYGSNVRDEEIITQVLSKYLNKEISDNGTNSRTLVNYIKQFFEKIFDYFKDLFGNISISKNDRITISGKDIKDALGFQNLAELINTKEISFNDVLGKYEFRNNKTTKKEDNNILKQAQLESKEKAWQELRNSLSRKVKKSKNFKKDHTYYVEKDGKRIKVEKSITTLNKELHGEKPYSGPNTPAAKIGNTFDAFIRDYFSEEGLKKSYPNLSDSQYKALKRQIESTLIPQFNKKFGTGNYKILTKFKEKEGNDELTVAGTANGILTAGTVDMIIVTTDGWYIYDMKTTLKGIDGKKEEIYSGQVTMYASLIQKEAKESGINLGKFNGYGLVVANVHYPTDGGFYTEYNNLDDITTDQVIYKGEPIQNAKGYSINISPLMDIKQDTLNLFYAALTNSDSVEEAEDKIIEEEEKAVTAQEKQGEPDIEEKAAQTEKNIEEQIETYSSDTLRPISTKEELIISKNAMKMAIYFANKVVSDRRGDWEYKIFKTRGVKNKLNIDALIRQEGVLKHILNFIREEQFGDINDITDDLTPEKAQYIYDNWQAIMNRGYNTLLRIARVGLNSNNSIEKTITEDDVMFEAFQIGERELNDNESYDIDKKEIDFQESIPTELKSRFYTIPKPLKDEDGVTIRREDGRSLSSYQLNLVDFYDGEKVIQSIASLVHSCSSVSQMMALMQQKQHKYPYFEQVLDILKDSDLQSKFFRTFRKNLTVYTTTSRRRSKMVQQTLNKIAKRDYIMQSLRSRLLSIDSDATPPMFKRDKRDKMGTLTVNKKALSSMVMLDSDSKDRSKLISAINSTGAGVRNLISILKSIGIDTIDNQSALVGEDGKVKKIKEALEGVHAALSGIDGKTSLLENTDVMKAYYLLASKLIDAVEDRANATQYNAGKNYQTFTQPTFIQDTIEELAGKKYKTVEGKVLALSTKDLLNDPSSRYLRYRQFSYLNGDNRVWVNSWLEKLASGDKDGRASKLIRYWSGTTVNKKKLFKQSTADYALDTLAHYFNPDVFSEYNEGEIAAFRVPNYADKNADGYIVFEKEKPAKGEKSYKDAITRRGFEYFLYELQRMRAVIQQAKDPNLASKDVVNFHLNRKKAAPLIEKIQKGEEITREDLVERNPDTGEIQLKDYVAGSGLSFKFVSDINEALTDPKSRLGDAIISILNDKDFERQLTKEEAKSLMSKFKKLFVSSMTANEKLSTATIKELLEEKGLKSIGLGKDADEKLEEFFWQNWLAVNNIYNLTIGDLAYYSGVTDVQKRFAEVNAGTEKANTEATFTTPTSSTPKNVSDGKMRVVVVKTETLSGDDISKRVEKILRKRAEELSKKNKKWGAKLESQIKSIVKGFKDIDATDGQGFATPTGFWKKMKMLGEMNPEFERAFKRVREGNFNVGDVDLCVETLKPFGYGFVEKEGSTLLGDELVPFQIKDSEAMIFLAGAILREGGENGGPLAAIYEAVEASHYSDKKHNLDTYVPNGIDVIVFDSGVKSGAYGVVDLNGLSFRQIKERLSTVPSENKSEDKELKDIPNLSIDEIKEFPFENWGKQQNTPAHMQDHQQAMSSQARILSISDFTEGDTIGGKPAKQVIKDYLKLIDDDIQEGIKVALSKLDCVIDADENIIKGPNFNKNLARKVKAKAVSDKRYSPEVVNGLSIFTDDGNLAIPFGDPSTVKAVMSTIFSAFKNNVNKEAMQGGPAVLTTGFGLNLGIKSDDKGIYYEAMTVPPTKTIERKVVYNAGVAKEKGYKFKGTYKNGDIISMEDIDANHILREDEKEFILTFIPCEDKYSMVRCKIKEFMPRFPGETQRVSKAITAITGKDFDIDKGYDEFFYDTEGLKEDIEGLKDKLKKENNPKEKAKINKSIENKKIKLTTWERKNAILRIKLDALASPQVLEKLYSTGEYKELENLAVKTDPTFKTGLGSLANFTNALAMHRRNAAGKEYVGISALNNVSHAIANLADIAFKRPNWAFSVNGTSVTELFEEKRFRVDPTYNMEGARISGILRQFVGAAADNGKKPILGSLNTNPITANMANGLIRMGFPLKTVIYMLNNPIIKEITRITELKGGRFEGHLMEFAEKYLDGFTEDAFNKTDFTDKELEERLNKPYKEKSITSVDKSVLYFFKTTMPYCMAISDLNQFTSLNSLQNAAGPTEFDERVKYHKMATIIERSLLEDSIWEKDVFAKINADGTRSLGKLFEEIPFLKPLYKIYEKYIPEIANGISPVYSEQFGDILAQLQQYGLDFSSIDMDFIKIMRGVVDAFELYRATGIFLKSDYQSRKKRVFDFPVSLNEKKFIELRDNTFMQAINIGEVSKKTPLIGAFSDVAMLSQDEREEVTASSADLIKSPANRNFVKQIAEYMFNRFGFSWKPKSTANLFANDVKILFGKDYREVFSPSSGNPYTTSNFIIQYARNNPDSFLWKTLKQDEDSNIYTLKDGVLTLSRNIPAFGIKLGNKLYILDRSKEDKNTYVETESLGAPNQFMEYNSEEDGGTMITIITDENIAAQLGIVKEKVRKIEEKLAEFDDDDYDGEDNDTNDTAASDFANNGPRRLSSQDAFTARDAVIEAIREDENITKLLEKKGVTAASFETESITKLKAAIDIINRSTSKKLEKVKELVKNLEKYC